MKVGEVSIVPPDQHQSRSVRLRHSAWSPRLVAILLTLCMTALIGLVGAPPASAQPDVVVLRPTAMTYTDSRNPGRNFSGETTLMVSKTQFHTYLAYDLSGLDPASIVSASLEVTIGTSAATRPALRVQQTVADWSESSLTHRSRPAAMTTILNPGDTSVPRAQSSIAVPIDLAVAQLRTRRMSLTVGYQHRFTGIELTKSTPPTLRLVVQVAPRAQVARSPKSLPYRIAPIASSSKKVFAHYFPPYPISIDDVDPAADYYSRHYLKPGGEKGKFRKVGGLLRDRPVGRRPLGSNYRLTDAVTEVRQAASSGIDGFTINIMNWSGENWSRTLLMARAASESKTGFVTIPNIDLATRARNTPVATIAARLNAFYSEPSAYRLPDGRYVLSSFKAEARPPGWWKDIALLMEKRYGKRIALITVFLHLSDARIRSYRSVSYAMSIWGLRTAQSVRLSPDKAHKVHKAGRKWMAPIAVQDVRHRSRTYAEAGNTETLRASWARAQSDQADMAQLITWNDYSESTHFAPSRAHGAAFLDLNGYYATQFKTGRAPGVSGDEVIITHRVQGFARQPSGQSGSMDWGLSGRGTKPRDTVEVVTLLKAAATVTVRAGSKRTTYVAPAGVHARVVALSRGQMSADVVRSGVPVATVVSPHRVTSTPRRWDLQYYAATSRKS